MLKNIGSGPLEWDASAMRRRHSKILIIIIKQLLLYLLLSKIDYERYLILYLLLSKIDYAQGVIQDTYYEASVSAATPDWCAVPNC